MSRNHPPDVTVWSFLIVLISDDRVDLAEFEQMSPQSAIYSWLSLPARTPVSADVEAILIVELPETSISDLSWFMIYSR